MISGQVHRIEDLLFSFSYRGRTQASRCNTKLQYLMEHSVVPELEKAFDQVAFGEINLELDRVEIDLGKLDEEDISEDLGERIKPILVKALKKAIRECIQKETGGMLESDTAQSENFSVMAMKAFFLKGYFPAWADSKLNLLALIEFLTTFHPRSLGNLILEVAMKSDAARKRIAFLDSVHFDRIVGILVPGEAEWILGYRNTYLTIHQKEYSPTDSSVNLANALNLFILNFIVRNSGPRFNRLSFSDRFLKSIAAHYNLDFREFLQEITEILRQNTIENQLYRDFREALTWVGEKNSSTLERSEDPATYSSGELIAWLNNPEDEVPIRKWIEDLAATGSLFSELVYRFPGFWRSLSNAGLTQLIGLLGGTQSKAWLELTYSYLAWHSRQVGTGTVVQETIVKEVFQMAQISSLRRDLSLYDLESWFSTFVVHAFRAMGTDAEITQSLLQLGLNSGISQAALVLARAKKNLKSGSAVDSIEISSHFSEIKNGSSSSAERNGSRAVSYAAPARIAEMALSEYLQSGTLSSSFQALAQTDLQWIVAQLVRSQDPMLLKLLRRAATSDPSKLKMRLNGLFEKLERSEVFDFIARNAGLETLRLLRFHKKLVALISAKSAALARFDRPIWSQFLNELAAETSAAKTPPALSDFWMSEGYLAVLRQLSRSDANARILHQSLKKYAQSEKNFLIDLARYRSEDSVFIPFLERVFGARRASLQLFGLLKTRAGGHRNFLRNQRLEQFRLHDHAKANQAQQSLLQMLSSESWTQQIQSGGLSQASISAQAAQIVARDLKLLMKPSNFASPTAAQKRELQKSTHRILRYSFSNPENLIRFFDRNKNQVLGILHMLFQNLSKADWQRLTKILASKMPGSLKIAVGHTGQTLVSSRAIFDHVEKTSAVQSSYFGELDGKLTAERLERLIPQHPELSHEISLLYGVSSRVFHKKSVFELWRKAILQAVYQLKLATELAQGSDSDVFWSALERFLKRNSTAFRPGQLDWSSLLQSKGLGAKSKTRLLSFYKKYYHDADSNRAHSDYRAQLSSAIAYLKEEGHLPWWSPIKSKSRLILALLFAIEHSAKDDALLLVSSLTDGTIAELVAGLNHNQLNRLQAKAYSSLYRGQLKSLSGEIMRRLQDLEHMGENHEVRSDINRISGFNNPEHISQVSAQVLEVWLKKQLNSSAEAETLNGWFGRDSRVFEQVDELLSWSRYFYFGNLNPGKWKLWVLSFSADYYLRKGNSYSTSFLSDFLKHLYRSQATVHWKVVFGTLLKNKDFTAKRAPIFLDEIRRLFPERPERIADVPTLGDQVKISNAGLILCWPFLSVLFSRLKLSSEGLIPVESQSKAVYLLQYLVYGHTDFPEYELVLNKILVGMKTSQHLEQTKLTEEEKDMVMSLLNGMKSNWEKMKNASVEAIRETFLQREGTLEFGSASNVLRIPKTGVDVLLDSITWNISVVKLPWMEKSLEVKWR